jgi:hypothetical protein
VPSPRPSGERTVGAPEKNRIGRSGAGLAVGFSDHVAGADSGFCLAGEAMTPFPESLMPNGSMTQVLTDRGPTLIFFCFVIAIAIALGTVIFILCRYPGSRRGKFREAGATSLWLAIVVGLIPTLGISAYAWNACWLRFHTITLTPNEIRLSYDCPSRQVVLNHQTLVGVRSKLTMNKGRSWLLVLTASDGNDYESSLLTARMSDQLYESVQNWMRAPPRPPR